MYYIAINGLISSKKKRILSIEKTFSVILGSLKIVWGGLRILGDAVRLDETPGAVRSGVIPLPICP